ncbi:hypothetical protein GS415_04185 [Rhodococcus hoagii]|nr:hypothetical protein [Prescottella equi]
MRSGTGACGARRPVARADDSHRHPHDGLDPVDRDGKVDAVRLPKPVRERSGAPTNPTDALVAEAYSAALGTDVDRPGRFFVVGGDSLLATAVVSQLRARLGRELPCVCLFDEPTVRGPRCRDRGLAGSRQPTADPSRAPAGASGRSAGPATDVDPASDRWRPNGIGWGRGWNCAVRWFRTPCTPH